MTTIVTRAGKGSPLSNAELDANFTNLNKYKDELVATELATNVSFDSVTTPGTYLLSGTPTGTNAPSAIGGYLEVYQHPDIAGLIFQRYTTKQGTSPVDNGRTFVRCATSSTWTAWSKSSAVGGYDDVVGVTGTASLTKAAHAGRMVRLSGTGYTATVAAASTFGPGDTLTIVCDSAAGETVSVALTSGDTASANHGAPGALAFPLTLRGGDTLILTRRTTTAWNVPFNSQAFYAKTDVNAFIRGGVNGLSGVASGTTLSAILSEATLRNAALSSWQAVYGSTTKSVNLATAGPVAGGRDQAGNFNSQWVYVYAISKPSLGTDYDLIVSASATAPTLPATYTTFWRLWPMRITSTNNTVVTHWVRGNRVHYANGAANLWNAVAIAGTSAYPATGLSVYVPPNGLSMSILITTTGTASTSGIVTNSATLRNDADGSLFTGTVDTVYGQASQPRNVTWTPPEIPIIQGANVSYLTDGQSNWASNFLYGSVASFTFY